MNYYTQEIRLSFPIGNNIFSYQERLFLGGKAEIVIPKLIQGNFSDVHLGKQVVFEEMDEERLISATGLQEFVEITLPEKTVFVFDNHNHAFYFWAKAKKEGRYPALPMIHVDQHKDMRIPDTQFTGTIEHLEDVAVYTNEVLNVGNFIVPAKQAGIISEIRILDREEQFLEQYMLPEEPFILDVDLDMFAPELSFMDQETILESVRRLYKKAAVVTFATSPFFITQDRALHWMHKIIQ